MAYLEFRAHNISTDTYILYILFMLMYEHKIQLFSKMKRKKEAKQTHKNKAIYII
jgi:hypothetical protein